MKVSVAMATYNGEQFLGEQLKSLAEQTRLPDELIVTDDGSTDKTLKVLQQFAKTAPFEIRVVTNDTNLGFAQNFGKALSLCTGDVIMLCDQDDYWYKDKIATMLDEMDVSPEISLFLCDTALTDEALRPIGATKLGLIRDYGLPDQAHVMGCCMAIRRALLQLALPIPQSIPAHDNWIAQLGDEFGTSKRLELTLQYHRRHQSNTSDYFVNKTHTLPMSKRLIFFIQRCMKRLTVSSGMQGEQNILHATVERLDNIEKEFERLVGCDQVKRTRSRLEERLSILEKRLAIRNKPHAARLPSIIYLWRGGGYRTHRGIAGAMKDLLLATPSYERNQR